MQTERVLCACHVGAVLLALTAALIWPRPGQAVLLVPFGNSGVEAALHWANSENAELLELDTASGRVVARMAPGASAAQALALGILPVVSRSRGCGGLGNG